MKILFPDPAVGCEKDNSMQGVTSQMVLLCSWRTVKEVSLLLGHLAEEATIAISSEGEVVSTSIISELKRRQRSASCHLVGGCLLLQKYCSLLSK